MAQKQTLLPGPSVDWIHNIVSIKKWTNPLSGKTFDLRIPSFLQIGRALKIGLKRGGIVSVTNPKSKYYPGNIKPRSA